MKTTVLIIEDSPSMARTYEGFLRKAGMNALAVSTGEEGMELIEQTDPDAVLLDLHLPDTNGLKILKRMYEKGLTTPVIAMTANGSMSTAIDAMREGARDFLVKPFASSRLIAALEQTFARSTPVSSQGEKQTDQKSASSHHDPAPTDRINADFLGSSLAMKAVFRTIEAAAPSNANVMITGESGTGKELAAEAIHRQSRRANRPLITLNCAAIPKDMLESHVFGHVKGSFTGAIADSQGAAELAHGGTLFLDELGEMDLGLQSKLLRLLQSGTYSRVGDARERHADIRFIAATNRAPEQAVRDGYLREDLFFRLSVVPIVMPPLRERGSDILLLAQNFLLRFAAEDNKRFREFDETGRAWLASHTWQGNVRELMNMIRRVVILTADGESFITADDLARCATVTNHRPARTEQTAVEAETFTVEPLHVTERRAIERALAVTEGNIQEAARLLEINPSTIYRKRTAWGAVGIATASAAH
ncbi:MAG: sigma-54 dependent transcriptional regulator [Pseudomonadota bacterium]